MSEMQSMAAGEEFLAHYGKKGMKWGVRKQAALERETRLSTGRGTARDKLRRVLTTNTGELVKAKGSYSQVSKNRAAKLTDQKAKLEAGKHWTQSANAQMGRKAAQIIGTTAVVAGAAYIAKARWDAGADARLFNRLQPELARRVSGIVEVRS